MIPKYISNIPDELKQFNNWVVYRHGSDDDKKPIRVDTLPKEYGADASNPHTWTSYENAITETEASDKLGGIGFELGTESAPSGVVCIDIDHCIDKKTRSIIDVFSPSYTLSSSMITEILTRFDTYTEISPSGTGLHLFLKGVKRFQHTHDNGIECYAHGRYIRMTGDIFNTDYSEELESRQDALDWLGDTFFQAKEQKEFSNTFDLSELDTNDLITALEYIDVKETNRGQWIAVATVLQKAGIPFEVWDKWSSKDNRSNKKGKPYYSCHECEYVWNKGFNGNTEGFTPMTIFYMAKKGGYAIPNKYLKNDAILPKRWKRPKESDNDSEVVQKYKDTIASMNISKSIEELKQDDLWLQILGEASQRALDKIVSYVDDIVPSHKRKNFKNYYADILSDFKRLKQKEYEEQLSPKQKKLYEQFLQEQKEKEFPVLDSNGKPVTRSEENMKHFLKLYGYEVKENQVTRLIEVYENGAYNTEYSSKLDTFYAKVMSQGSEVEYDISKQMIIDMLRLATVKYNPLIEYFERSYHKWDKQEGYVDDLFSCFVLEDSCTDDDRILLYKWFGKWLVQLVLIAHNNGGKHDVTPQTMLVLVGEKQGQGKGTWGEKILPAGLVLREGVLKPSDKDSVYKCTCAGLTELAEFSRSTKYVDELKSFLTTKLDIMRRPYDAKESYFPRTTSFYGTVNNTKFLLDDTGNRRFIVIPIKDINRDKLNALNMDMVWGEVYQRAIIDKSIDISVSPEEAKELSCYNEQFRDKDSIEKVLEDVCKFEDGNFRWYNCTEICDKVFEDRKLVKEVGKVLSNWVRDGKIAKRIIHKKSEYYLPL